MGEDAALFRQDLEYTMISGKNLLVWRYPAKDALRAWPLETCQHLRSRAILKYNNVYDSAKLQNSLYLTHSNQLRIDCQKQVEQQLKNIYPLANRQAKTQFKLTDMQSVE